MFQEVFGQRKSVHKVLCFRLRLDLTSYFLWAFCGKIDNIIENSESTW